MGNLASTAPTRSGRIYSCKIETLLRNADDEDRAAVADRMAATEDFSSRSLAAWLGVSEGTVTKHRTQDCACFR